MDKDRVNGAIDDAAGRVKRQVGEWTGDTGTQVEGAAQQVKGKTEKAWGTVKDAARNATDEAQRTQQKLEKKPAAREQPERDHAVQGNR